MTTHLEDRYCTVALRTRESATQLLYVHEDLRNGWGYRLSRHADGAAKIRDLSKFVGRNRADLDRHAAEKEFGTLRWDALHITEHRYEHHENCYAWSGLVNQSPAEYAI